MKGTSVIVVPVDFSESTGSLVEYAVYMAGKLSATAHFVHVLDMSQFTYYAGDIMFSGPYPDDVRDQLLENVQEKMSTLVKDNCSLYPGCKGDVIVGDPVDKIVEFAKEKNSDLIIISTHGARGLEKILLGTVAGRVVKRAHCPVLTMNPFKKFASAAAAKEARLDQEKSKGVIMEVKEDFRRLVEKLKTERDELKLRIHLGSMDAQKEFEESEEKWGHVKKKASDIADAGKATSEEFISKAKIVGDELKDTYSRISKRLSK